MKWKACCFVMGLLVVFLIPLGAVESNYKVVKLLNKGWIKGRVTHAKAAFEIPRLEVNRDGAACGTEPRAIQAVEIGADGSLQNAIVYLKDITAGKDFVLSGTPPVLRQTHCDFQPHVQLVPPRSSIKITNEDHILHSVHAFWFPLGAKFVLYPDSVTYPAKTLFNVAMVAQRKESFQQLGAPGIVKFICEAGHYWMTAYVIVTPHPYFAKVDSQGNFTLEDVPPGKYTLVSWHEYFGSQERSIVVKENQPTQVKFTYSEEL